MKTFLIVLTTSLTLLVALTLSISLQPSEAAAQDLPYTFFFTHYELLGDPNNPEGVRYHSNGKPSAKAPDGSKVILSGNGGWDPSSQSAQGGGRYTIEDASGKVTAKGSWQVTDFTSFEQLDGWWGMGPQFKEKGWQGPPGSTSFSGFLKLQVHLENKGDGVLTAWCLMPAVSKPDDHQGDGISLTGANFDFTDFSESEMSFEGVMFYSSDPASKGYVLTSDGHTVRKTALTSSTASATASPTAANHSATASASPLPTSGGPPLIWVLTLVAALVLVGSGGAALALLRRGFS
ncbi:MAG: hypothetical protein ACR2FR_08925 [Rubrobacter sp.]